MARLLEDSLATETLVRRHKPPLHRYPCDLSLDLESCFFFPLFSSCFDAEIFLFSFLLGFSRSFITFPFSFPPPPCRSCLFIELAFIFSFVVDTVSSFLFEQMRRMYFRSVLTPPPGDVGFPLFPVARSFPPSALFLVLHRRLINGSLSRMRLTVFPVRRPLPSRWSAPSQHLSLRGLAFSPTGPFAASMRSPTPKPFCLGLLACSPPPFSGCSSVPTYFDPVSNWGRLSRFPILPSFPPASALLFHSEPFEDRG